MDTPLPPFGIRGLCSPDKPFSVLQVSENEYDATVKSYSDAALTWLDEDDGETITVGTGWELRERLNDPTPTTAPLIRFLNDETERLEDRYVHLFDINKSQASLDVWREHEAYWSKPQNPCREVSNLSEDVAEEKNDEFITESTTNPINMPSENADGSQVQVVDTAETSTTVSLPDQTPTAKSNVLPEILGSLATILQTTSDILNRMAQKTRETDTSPIEDILSGMAEILGETGAFGLNVLEGLDQAVNKSADTDSSSANDDTSTATTVEVSEAQMTKSSKDEESQHLSFTEKGDVDMSGSATCLSAMIESQDQAPAPAIKTPQQRLEEDNALLKAIPTQKLQQHVLSRDKFGAYQHLREEPLDWTQLSTRQLKAELQHRAQSAESSIPTSVVPVPMLPSQSSLLDQDAEDADFTARYPPLTTLRRARTVATLRDNVQTEPVSDYSFAPFIQRPSPQVFDAETRRRKEFARACFPTQEYTPGLGPIISNCKQKQKSSQYSVQVGIIPDISQCFTSPPDPEVMRGWNRDRERRLAEMAEVERTSVADNHAVEHGYKPLPGAWPDMMPEKAPLLAPSSPESSGAFFNRMMNELGLQSNQNEESLANSAASLHRHKSLADHIAKPKPSNGLFRSQTVSDINPAARLNRPFESAFPVLPVEPKSEAPAAPSKQSTTGPVRSLHRNSSDRRPRSLYEPYRPFSSHRSFSPVWEDHLKHPDFSLPAEIKDPFSHPSDLVTIYASGFAPDSTEADITAIIQEHCKDKWGRNCLQECRILSAEPVITVKLVLKDSIVAGQIIAVFDKLTLAGCVLRFGRNQSIVEHGARECHRYKQHRNTHKAPSRMRSLPTFAASARPRPHLNVASRPRIIPDESVVRSDPQPIAKPMLSTRPEMHDDIDACEKKLRAMGYGADDPAMESRLHVYAAAACGSVEEAIELIEEDKDAHQAAANTKVYTEQPSQQVWT